MKKLIVVGVIGLLIGGAVGTNASRYFARQHANTTAVMVLLQAHQQGWERAVQGHDCGNATRELQALQFLAGEIAVALPLADAQDSVFHQHIEKIRAVLSLPSLMQCAASINEIKQVNEACDACHREYR